MAIIQVKNLTKSYSGNRGITDVNFTINQGDVFGFIGPNGSGKSTTIRILMGLLLNDSGNASVFGLDAYKNSAEIKQSVGYVPSDSVFYANFKVADLLQTSARLRGCPTDRIKELTRRFDLDTSKRIRQLSFGNRKKVSIILALLHRPKLLIMDEPTSGLDPIMQSVFFDTMIEERNNGTTIMLSTHILGEIQKICNRAAIIKEGTVIADESIEFFRSNTVKSVKFSYMGEPKPIELEGVSNIVTQGNEVSFDYNGELNSLLRVSIEHNLSELLIKEADIEKIFMNYYQ